ncbi:MAG: tRNA(Ile)-lysidine synthase [Elusimicrobia bacterium]|nr:tRNA(Ile)-lysidine synthase [Elusimicrobiota bacterium]
MALGWLLKEWQAKRGFHVEVAHINHKLRGLSSEGDEKFVRDISRQWGWTCHVRNCAVRPLKKGNLEEVAREKRYAMLEALARQHHLQIVMTAHTLDDQVETVFMNLMRGTGCDGLSGMAPLRKLERSKVWLARPLLNMSKKELLGRLRSSRRRFRLDATNRNLKYLRNWLRAELIPKIEKKSPGFKKRIFQLSEMVYDEKLEWEKRMKGLDARLLKDQGPNGRLLDLKRLLRYSPAVQRRFLRRSLGRDLLTYEAVEQLREWMKSPPSGGRLWQLRKGWVVERLSKSKGSPTTSMFVLRQTK